MDGSLLDETAEQTNLCLTKQNIAFLYLLQRSMLPMTFFARGGG